MTEQEIKKAIGDVEANFALENMFLTDEDRNRLKKILTGETTAEYEIEMIISQYKESKVGVN